MKGQARNIIYSGAPNENIVQNHKRILVFKR